MKVHQDLFILLGKEMRINTYCSDWIDCILVATLIIFLGPGWLTMTLVCSDQAIFYKTKYTIDISLLLDDDVTRKVFNPARERSQNPIWIHSKSFTMYSTIYFYPIYPHIKRIFATVLPKCSVSATDFNIFVSTGSPRYSYALIFVLVQFNIHTIFNLIFVLLFLLLESKG